jgi:hypothetical protein
VSTRTVTRSRVRAAPEPSTDNRGVSDCCTPGGYRQVFSERSAEGATVLEVGGGIGAIQIEQAPRRILTATESRGLRTVRDRSGLVWQVVVFERT